MDATIAFPRNLCRDEYTGGRSQAIRVLIEVGQRKVGLYGSRYSGWSIETYDANGIGLTVSLQPYRTKAVAMAVAAMAYGVKPSRVRPWRRRRAISL